MSSRATRRPSWRRAVRVLAWSLLAVLVVLGGTVWTLRRSWYIVRRAEPVLSSLFGGPVDVGSASYVGAGVFELRDVVARAPGMRGLAGEVGRIERATVRLDLQALQRGRVQPLDLHLEGVHVRLAESEAEPGRFNIGLLDPKTDPSAAPIPHVTIGRAVIELGVDEGGVYRARGSRAFRGDLRPDPDVPTQRLLLLEEIDPRGETVPDGLLVRGVLDATNGAVDVSLEGLDLDETTESMCPALVRVWWNRMELEGSIRRARLAWDEHGGLRLEADLRDAGMTMPVETGDLFAWYRGGRLAEPPGRPRMLVHRGTLRLARDSFELEGLRGRFTGEAAVAADVTGVDYSIDLLRIDDLPPLDWAQRDEWMSIVATRCPFRLEFAARDLVVGRADDPDPPLVVLPAAIVSVLERFRLESWRIDTSAFVERLGPDADPDPVTGRRLRLAGRARIAQARGAYEHFPYPLSGVSANLEFDHRRVVVTRLGGSGRDGARAVLDGVVTLPEAGGGFDLRLQARAIPLDDALRDALPASEQAVFDALFPAETVARLAAHDLLPGASSRARAAARRAVVVPADEPLTCAALDAIAAQDDFALGGTVDLDLRVSRASGAAEPALRGRISFDRVGVVYRDFPYPIVAGPGALALDDRAIRLVGAGDEDGIPVTLAGGGAGTISGELTIVRDDEGRRGVRPLLRLTASHDLFGSPLFAALPPSRRPGAPARPDWPGGDRSVAGAMLESLGFEGVAEIDGRLGWDERDGLTHRFDVVLEEAGIRHGAELVRRIGGDAEADGGWWTLDGMRARMTVALGEVRVSELSGRFKDATISGSLRLLNDERGELDLDVRGLSADAHLLALAPERDRERLRAWWESTTPQGTLDARVSWRAADAADAPEAASSVGRVEVRVQPRTLVVTLGDAPVEARRTAGAVGVSRDGVELDGLEIALAADGREQGSIVLDGRLDPGRSALAVSGVWEAGRLRSPLVREVLRRVERDDVLRLLDESEADGRFRLVFDLGGTFAEPVRRVVLEPHELTLRLRGTPLTVIADPAARLVLEGDRATLTAVGGTTAEARFRVDGTAQFGGGTAADLRLVAEGRLASGPLAAILPEGVRAVLDGLAVEERQPTRLEDGRLRMLRADDGTQQLEFSGRLAVDDAALGGAVPMHGVRGTLDVELTSGGERPLRIAVRPAFTEATVLERRLEDVTGVLSLSIDGRRIVAEDVTARLGAGRIEGVASVGLEPGDESTASVRLVGVPISALRAASTEAPPTDADAERGRVWGEIAIAARRGLPETRIGRFALRAIGPALADVPVGLRVIQALSLSAPVRSLDYATAEGFIAGSAAYAERVVVEASAGGMALQQFVGEGMVDLESGAIDLQLRSRGTLPIVRDLLALFGDRLAVVRITGTWHDPTAEMRPAAPRMPLRAPPLRLGAAAAAAVAADEPEPGESR